MRILKALLLPFLLILSLIGVDRLPGKHKTCKHPQGICGVHTHCELIPAMGR